MSETTRATLDSVDVAVLRARWSRLAGEVGRDLSGDNSLNVGPRMDQLADLESYIALVEAHHHARRPRWRRWEFWRKVILGLSILATLTLLYLAFTHPSDADVRLDLRATAVSFQIQKPLRLSLGRRFETISVTGLDRIEYPDASGQRVMTGTKLVLSNDRDPNDRPGGSGRLDLLQIPAGARLRIQASGGEVTIRFSADAPPSDESVPPPSVRFALEAGSRISVRSESGEAGEQGIAVGREGSSAIASIEGVCTTFPFRMEVTFLLANDDSLVDNSLRLGKLSGEHVTRLTCIDDDLVSGERRTTLMGGSIRFPDIEVPEIELDEGTLLTLEDFKGSLARVEIDEEGVHVTGGGQVSNVLLGVDQQHSAMPSQLESLFARRFRMYVTGVLLYAIVFIVALLKGEKASIGEGFRPHSLMGMVRGGGHL